MGTFATNTTIAKHSQTTILGTLPGAGVTSFFTVPAGKWAKGKIFLKYTSSFSAIFYVNGIMLTAKASVGPVLSNYVIEFEFDNFGDDSSSATMQVSGAAFADFVYCVTMYKNTP